jgi:hypothetical protein
MLNMGLIGDIKLLEPYTNKAQENPEVHITGKSSVGIQPKPESFRLQAPEFNRIELIERSDALLINRFSLLPFQLLCDMVKKSKHFLATSYPQLNSQECTVLAKLANEAKTVIQFANPFYYLPAVQWLNKNLKKPVYIEVSYFKNESLRSELLIQLILMLQDIGISQKKIGAVTYHSRPANSEFSNVQMESGDGTLINIAFGKSDTRSEFKIKTFARDQFVEFDFDENNYTCNRVPIDLTEFNITNETDSFLIAIFQKKKAVTDIEKYAIASHIATNIQEKLDRYSIL